MITWVSELISFLASHEKSASVGSLLFIPIIKMGLSNEVVMATGAGNDSCKKVNDALVNLFQEETKE